MSGCSSSRRAARSAWRSQRVLSLASRSSACLALLGGCLPERALSSYSEQRGAPTAIRSRSGTSRPDAGLSDASLSDAGASDVAPERRDAGASDAAPSVDAVSQQRPVLACRGECACELGALGEFMFCPTPVSHEEAVARCSLAGGTLASVDDAAQNAQLSARMTALAADDFWLSGTDSAEEGVWRWSDGRVFYDADADGGITPPYAPWDDGQPNDLDGEDCMRSTGGVWRDLDCSDEIAFVCQG